MEKDKVANKEKFSMIQDVVSCSICCNVITDPVQCTQCENSFCKTCIDNWKKKSDDCPFKCVQSEMKPSRTIRLLLSQILFECPNKCGTEIPHDEYDKHCNETCTKLDYKEKYKSLIESFKALKLENGKLKTNNQNQNQNAHLIQHKSSHHVHPLIYNYLNRIDWQCNVCSKRDKTLKKGSYYCKECDFDLCENCKKVETNGAHEHILYYININRVNWVCNVCQQFFANLTSGSFYCKECDFDLCAKCKLKEPKGHRYFEIN